MILAWMLYAVAIGALAAGAAVLLELLAAPRGLRRLPWIVALVATIAVPVLVAVRPVGVPDARAALEINQSPGSGSLSVVSLTTGIDWDSWLLFAWATASIVILVAFTASAIRLRRASRRGQPMVIDGAQVTLTDDVGPGALCFGAARIIVPASLLTLDPSRRALLLRHEREHLKAGDPHVLFAALAALACVPWNLPLWYIVRRLRMALELDCDSRVLEQGGDVHVYGDLLLTVASTRRPPRLAGYLAFAAAPSLLERRIRAMTARRRSLAPAVQLSLGLAALAAVVAACETRRPEPLAPVASYTIADGKVTPTESPRAATNDSARIALDAEVRSRVSAATLNGKATDPLLIVYDADGNTVMTGRLGVRDAQGRMALDSIPFPPEAIASVDVIKSGVLLPPEARAGLIKVVLKRDASGVSKRARSGGGNSSMTRVRVSGASEAPPANATAIIISSDGRELLRQQVSDGSLDALPIETASIATVNVMKATAERSEIHITLKPGEGLSKKR